MAAYNRQAAVAYAQKWARRRNPRYLNFDAMGGDCTNFISQCLFAGCNEMDFTPDTGWYYRSSYDRAAAWTGVMYLHQFLTARHRLGPRAVETTRDQLVLGDVIQLGHENGTFYHSLLVVAIADDRVHIAAHSDDYWMRDLDTYRYDQARFLHIADA
ncbi:MAG: amidase domain-containing protein [Oscillospiraceae bacterium]|jgi:hypothetical protein|nr:amidase domain-containing protein [Oscillospiraceae bacterium]